MYVLHIYPSALPMLAQYVSMLTVSDDIQSTDNPKAFRQMCAERRPDIVHMHGCMDMEILKAVQWARQQGSRILITPHGQLSPWESKRPFHQSILRQLVPHAYVVIARSPMEASALDDLEWNSRMEIVPNPLITRTTTRDLFIASHQRIYKQVMDTNVLELMDETTCSALRTLLKAGITQDERWVEPFDTQTVNWHLLHIYAYQEGVLNMMERGLLTMGINSPESTIPPSYLPNYYNKPESMGTIPLTEIIKEIYRQYDDEQLPLLSLVELDVALRRDDVEDDMLMQQLSAEKLDEFLAALLPVVQEQTGLDEGFMPCASVENSITMKIRNMIKKHLEI